MERRWCNTISPATCVTTKSRDWAPEVPRYLARIRLLFSSNVACYTRTYSKSLTAKEMDPSHKSHKALDKYPTVHHFVTKMCTHVHIYVTKWCTGGYGTVYATGLLYGKQYLTICVSQCACWWAGASASTMMPMFWSLSCISTQGWF